MKGYVLLICNGEAPPRAFVRRLAKRASLVVAADGGANTARRYGIRPDLIIGDLDSITPATRRHFASTRILRVPRQDNTDLEKALDAIAAEHPGRVMIVGATGGRIDFTLANLSVIWNYLPFLDVSLAGRGWRAFPLEGRAEIRARRGTTLSLIPFGACSGITLGGLEYPLKGASMGTGDVAVSNVVRRSPCVVEVKKGKLLVMLLDRQRKARRPR